MLRRTKHIRNNSRTDHSSVSPPPPNSLMSMTARGIASQRAIRHRASEVSKLLSEQDTNAHATTVGVQNEEACATTVGMQRCVRTATADVQTYGCNGSKTTCTRQWSMCTKNTAAIAAKLWLSGPRLREGGIVRVIMCWDFRVLLY